MQSSKSASGNEASPTPEIVSAPFLRRIEKLALILLEHRFNSSQDLWKFQLDLLHLQRDIQGAVNDCKSKPRRELPMEVLTEVRVCRWHARRLGDAFAWVVLGGDKKVIEPLSENKRIPISRDGHGSRGMLLIASHLGNQGWGFPLIHDITDFLRIGDLTFVRVSENSKRSYQTVEVKTRAQLKRRLAGQNLAEYEYQVQVLSAAPFDHAQSGPVKLHDAEFDSVIANAVRPIDERAIRQAKRMSAALAHQTAKANELIRQEGGIPAIWSEVSTPVTRHWRTLQKVVRKARRSGYASECVDGAFLYTAFYNHGGISVESMGSPSRIHEAISNSGLLIQDGSRDNAISIYPIPANESRGAHVFRPFYLYPIPRTSICDIIYGRMIIVVFLNESRLVESLERAGFSVEVTSNAKDRQIKIGRQIAAGSGENYYAQYPNFRHYLNEIVYEFNGRESIIHIAETIFETAGNMAAEIRREAEHKGTRRPRLLP
jgi:hypothetical protein